jgi:hypothetical protein
MMDASGGITDDKLDDVADGWAERFLDVSSFSKLLPPLVDGIVLIYQKTE